MKTSIALTLLTLSLNSFALPVGYYVGTSNGSACHIEINNPRPNWGYVTTNIDFYCYYDQVEERSNKLIMKGFNEIERCKAVVTLDSSGNPVEYKLKVRNILSPIYLPKGSCKNLVKE